MPDYTKPVVFQNFSGHRFLGSKNNFTAKASLFFVKSTTKEHLLITAFLALIITTQEHKNNIIFISRDT